MAGRRLRDTVKDVRIVYILYHLLITINRKQCNTFLGNIALCWMI